MKTYNCLSFFTCYLIITFFVLHDQTVNAQDIMVYRLEKCEEMEKDHSHDDNYYILDTLDYYGVSLREHKTWTGHDKNGRKVIMAIGEDPTGRTHYVRKPFHGIIANIESNQDFSLAIDVQVKSSEDDCVLLITLFNSGNKTFVVDKEFGITLDIVCFDKDLRMISTDGSKITYDDNNKLVFSPRPYEAEPTTEEWEKRFISLEPGFGITQKVSMLKGWRFSEFSITSGLKPYMSDYRRFLPKDDLRLLDMILIRTITFYDRFGNHVRQGLFAETTGIPRDKYTLYEGSTDCILIEGLVVHPVSSDRKTPVSDVDSGE